MQRAILFAVSTIALAAAGSAAADSPNLKGSYGFTGTAACLVAPGHVGDANTPPPLPNPTPGVALANSGFNARLQPNDSQSSRYDLALAEFCPFVRRGGYPYLQR